VRCPFCSFDSTRVVDSRLTDPGDSIRRRRECAGCGNRFTTHERAEEVPVDVVKRDGTTQRFDRRKLLRGLVRAAGGRPVGGEQLEVLADSIAAEIRRAGVSEVKAERIGDLAERGLAQLDPVTAIQFASVYRRLADLDELEAVVRKLREEPVPGIDQLAIDPDIVGVEGPVPSDPKSRVISPLVPPTGTSNTTESAEERS
jgi:transcriptional repressor NrdR